MVQPLLLLLTKHSVLLLRHLGIRLGGFDKILRCRHVLQAEQQNAVRRLAVASGASCLLIIALDVFGHIEVYDKAHIGLVNAHTKGVGRYHDPFAVIDEILLIPQPLVVGQAGVIARRRIALFAEEIADSLHLFARGAVDDPCLVAALLDQLEQCAAFVLRPHNGEKQVGTVKAGRQHDRLTQPQQPDDIRLDVLGRGRRKRADDRTHRQTVDKPGDIQIARTKILSPLRHAMRLVDRDQRDRQRPADLDEPLADKPLRRDIDDLVDAVRHIVERLVVLSIGKRAVEICRANAGGRQRVDLILHQRDQRRDDQRDPVKQKPGHLIANRLSGAGRHDRQRVAPVEDTVNNLLLSRAKPLVAVIPLENMIFFCLDSQPSFVRHFFTNCF